jgi:plasmid stabilization system protein ParE
MRAVWTKNALAQLADIHQYISLDSKRYAIHMVDRITGRIKQIRQFPNSGQMVPEFNDPSIRELLEGPYRIIYRVEPKRIAVLALIHGARTLTRDNLG